MFKKKKLKKKIFKYLVTITNNDYLFIIFYFSWKTFCQIFFHY